MKDVSDQKTVDAFGGPVRGRGRPPSPDGAMTAAERQRARRERLAAVGETSLTVTLPRDVLDALSKFVEFKDLTKSQVVEKVLRDRLLRKR